jgi:hypothetical protein
MTGRRSIAVAVVAAAVVAGPGRADAHIRSGVVAGDYRAAVSRTRGLPRALVRARIYAGDRALGLTLARGHLAAVLDSSGAVRVRLDARGDRRSVVWHDSRLAAPPPGRTSRRWVVPVVVDGVRGRLEGRTWRVRAPPVWPWLIIAAPILAAGLLRRRPADAVALAGLAALATLLLAAGFGAAGDASAHGVVEALDELAFLAVGVAFLRRGSPERRARAAVAVGFLALVVGSLHLAVLGHGVVFSALPTTATRAAVAVALAAGAAAVTAGAALAASGLSGRPEMWGVTSRSGK